LWNEKNKHIIDELITDDYIDHTTPPYVSNEELQGPETFKRVFTAIQDVFFDIHVSIKDQIVEDDKVVTHAIWECTLKSDDDPPVAAQVVTVRGIGIDRIDGGKIVENWNTLDVLYRLISQLELADPFIDPDTPIPPAIPCDPAAPRPCRFGRVCRNRRCVKA